MPDNYDREYSHEKKVNEKEISFKGNVPPSLERKATTLSVIASTISTSEVYIESPGGLLTGDLLSLGKEKLVLVGYDNSLDSDKLDKGVYTFSNPDDMSTPIRNYSFAEVHAFLRAGCFSRSVMIAITLRTTR